MPLTLKGQDQDSISKRGGNVWLKPNNTPILVLLEGVKKKKTKTPEWRDSCFTVNEMDKNTS